MINFWVTVGVAESGGNGGKTVENLLSKLFGVNWYGGGEWRMRRKVVDLSMDPFAGLVCII